MIYLGTVNKNRRGKESLALLKKWPKMHFEEKILEKKACLHSSYKNNTTKIFKEHETVTKKLT